MKHIYIFIRTVLLSALIFLSQGCSEEGIIPEKIMASITMETYLADQYIEIRPQLRAQTDSLTVYPAIVAKYGYTMDEYTNSIRYYLQEGGTYTRIVRSAFRQLEKRNSELDALFDQQTRMKQLARRSTLQYIDRWWAIDSLKTVVQEELKYDPVLRAVRWQVVPNEKLVKWKITDSAVVDIPQNPQWWSNNLNVPAKRKYTDFYVRAEQVKEKEN